MKVVLQRVKRAKVKILDDGTEQEINRGIVLLCAICKKDTEEELKWVRDKCLNLRIFEDSKGKMNLSVLDIKGEVLAISNFTVAGNTRKGRRPSFDRAETPERAEKMFVKFINFLKEYGLPVKTGKFGAKMLVEIENDGPVTLIVEKSSQKGD